MTASKSDVIAVLSNPTKTAADARSARFVFWFRPQHMIRPTRESIPLKAKKEPQSIKVRYLGVQNKQS